MIRSVHLKAENMASTIFPRVFLVLVCLLLGVLLVDSDKKSPYSFSGYWNDCSEALCGPRVSKCMLIKSCNCSITPEVVRNKQCKCCTDCIRCLGEQYTDCCSCVGLCKPAKKIDPRLSMKSFVATLEPDEDEKALFEVFSKDPKFENGEIYSSYTFPTVEGGKQFYKHFAASNEAIRKDLETVNCTVVYHNKCLPMDKCRLGCQSLGASAYRWFHTGCCECIGEVCFEYGSNVGRCSECGELDGVDNDKPEPKKEL